MQQGSAVMQQEKTKGRYGNRKIILYTERRRKTNVERLVYLPAAEGALGLRYEEGADNVRKKFHSNIDIFRTFKNEGAFYGDLCLSRNNVDSFRMGWSGAIVFIKTGNRFEVTEISSIGTGGVRFAGGAAGLGGRTFHQITTQAVDTCTIYYIDAGDQYMLAHFNMSKISEFQQYLGNWINNKQIQAVFCSALKEKYDNDRGLKRAYNTIKGYAGRAPYILLDRTRCGEECYLSQMEFGLSCNTEDETVFFGDVSYRTLETRNPLDFPDVQPSRECGCFTYEYNEVTDLQRLRGTAENLFGIEPEPGCC